jgi:hypothetical protein
VFLTYLANFAPLNVTGRIVLSRPIDGSPAGGFRAERSLQSTPYWCNREAQTARHPHSSENGLASLSQAAIVA